MTAEEREKVESLCQQLSEEKDPVRFDHLVLALNELLEGGHQIQSTPSEPSRTETTLHASTDSS